MKLFVWDLHGTLEQGNEKAVIELSNDILERFGYTERFDAQYAQELYGLKWYQYFERLFPEAGHDRHIELQAACFELSNSSAGASVIASYMQPSQGALELLAAIKARHHQVLISNTTPESIPLFINALGMEEFFDETNSLAVNMHTREATRTKKDILAMYLNDRSYDDYIIIGDSDSDMDLTEVAGGKGYLYTHCGLMHRGNRGRRIHDLKELLVEL